MRLVVAVPRKAQKTPHVDEADFALETLAHWILKSPGFRGASLLSGLFRLLWQNRKRVEPTTDSELWTVVWKNTEDDYKKSTTANECIRAQCSALRTALDDYFRGTLNDWIIRLPPGGPARGYRLEWFIPNDPRTAAWLFWQSHLNWRKDISLAYAEHVFYHDHAEGFVFRYYDCNAHDDLSALRELEKRHPHNYTDALKVFHPYVAHGEMEAKELIQHWFRERLFRAIEPIVTRYQAADAPIWQHSLVLLGSAASNRFIASVLQPYSDLPVHLADRLRVRIAGPLAPADLARLKQQGKALRYELSGDPEDSVSLDFHAGATWVPAVLTRVPNPRATRAPVTILNSHYGRAVEQLARALTVDEHRLQQGMEFFNIRPPYPANFQYLCAVSITMEAGFHIRPLLWCPYSLPGF